MSDTETVEAPYQWFTSRAEVERLAQRFYDLMEQQEPRLTELHRLDSDGKVTEGSRGRFALFLVGWLGGPQEYMQTHGHPRLRMRHAGIPIDSSAHDAWLRCMNNALDEAALRNEALTQERTGFLRQRFADVADFLKNRQS